jgi:hypothetical protein
MDRQTFTGASAVDALQLVELQTKLGSCKALEAAVGGSRKVVVLER